MLALTRCIALMPPNRIVSRVRRVNTLTLTKRATQSILCAWRVQKADSTRKLVARAAQHVLLVVSHHKHQLDRLAARPAQWAGTKIRRARPLAKTAKMASSPPQDRTPAQIVRQAHTKPARRPLPATPARVVLFQCRERCLALPAL